MKGTFIPLLAQLFDLRLGTMALFYYRKILSLSANVFEHQLYIKLHNERLDSPVMPNNFLEDKMRIPIK